MDLVTRFSAGIIVDNSNMSDAIYDLAAFRFSSFLFCDKIQGDEAFASKKFFPYLKSPDILYCPVPPERHSQNMTGSKHSIIGSIFYVSMMLTVKTLIIVVG